MISSYVRTVIQSQQVYEAIRSKGLEFATTESCLAAVMRIACDKKINGTFLPGFFPFKFLSSTGHSFAVVPESVAPAGFTDLDEDDFINEESFISRFQSDVVRLRGDDWS